MDRKMSSANGSHYDQTSMYSGWFQTNNAESDIVDYRHPWSSISGLSQPLKISQYGINENNPWSIHLACDSCLSRN